MRAEREEFNIGLWRQSQNAKLKEIGPICQGVTLIELLPEEDDYVLESPPLGTRIVVHYDSGLKRHFAMISFERMRHFLSRAVGGTWMGRLPILLGHEISAECIAMCIERYLGQEALAALHEGLNVEIYNLFKIPPPKLEDFDPE